MSDIEQHNELMAEYNQLRQEILHNETQNTQILTTILLVVSAIMGFAFTEQVTNFVLKGFFFFLAEIVTVIGLLQTTDRGRSTFLIASYLRTFVETQSDNLRWETRLSKFRRHSADDGYGGFIGNQLWVYTVIILSNFALASWFIFAGTQDIQVAQGVQLAQNPFPLAWLLVALGLALVLTGIPIFIGWNLYNRYVRKHQQTFEKTWQMVRDEEKRPKAKGAKPEQ